MNRMKDGHAITAIKILLYMTCKVTVMINFDTFSVPSVTPIQLNQR